MSGSEGGAASEQLTLLRAAARQARKKPPKPAREPASDLPVARVAVDVALPHLDRPFDYLVPVELSEVAAPGVRVRVRFAGRQVDGFILERRAASAHEGRLAFLTKVVSPEPVLAPEVARLAREVADHYGGSMSDVLRLAVPPRHAGTEVAGPPEPALPSVVDRPVPGPWDRYPRGGALLDAISAGAAPRAAWSALPGGTWPDELALLVLTALAAGRGALVVLPDARDVARAADALAGHARDVAVVLTADAGPAARYRRWLAVRRGQVSAVVGTRAAMFAPVRHLGLCVVWDDGDDLHEEPRAPYPHVRTVLAMRSRLEGAALVIGGFARTAETAALLRSGWAEEVVAERHTVRRLAPAVRAGDDEADPRDPAAGTARLPSLAWRTAAAALETGPVLVQVPRGGYVPGLACADCRTPARCAACSGPLAAAGPGQPPACRWCGAPAAGHACPSCGGTRFRATVVGSRRTAEELGRAFPRVPVRSSGGSSVLAAVGAEPALVVATPGAEPVADGGYAAALLLDGWALLARPDLRAAEETVRRWMGAAALVRPAPEGGRVVVMAEAGQRAVQALVRWDPGGFADRELADRTALRLPPDSRMVSLTGSPTSLRELLAVAPLPPGTDVLGPVQTGDSAEERLILRAARADARRLVAAVREAVGVRSAHKDAGGIRVQVDPREIA